MGISNNPIKQPSHVSPTPQTVSVPPQSPSTLPPLPSSSPKPESFKPTTTSTPVSSIPSEPQIQNSEARIEQVSQVRLQENVRDIPPPLGLKVITEKAETKPIATVTTQSFTKEQFAKQLIGPNFVSNAKELRNTWFFKSSVLQRASDKAERISANIPPDSDLMHTLVSTSAKDLREMVAQGIALSRPDKYNDKTTYAQLSPNKQKLVDAIVKGLQKGMPDDLRAASQSAAETGADVQQVARHGGLMDELRQTKLRPPTEETLKKLDAMANKGLELAKDKIKSDHEALRTQLSYDNLPVPDPSEVSLSVLGDERIKALAPVDSTLGERASSLLKGYQGGDKDKVLWTLAMRPFGDTVNSVAARLYPNTPKPTEEQMIVARDVALSLVQASMKQIGPDTQNTLIDRDPKGNPKTVEINGKSFEQVRQLGKGGFGVAFLFRAKDGEEVVVKKFMRKNMDDENWFGAMQDEIRCHRYAMGPDGKGHENMLNLKGVVISPPGKDAMFGEFFTVTEAAKGGEMRDLMGKMHQQLQDKRISKTVYDLLNRQLFAQTIEGMHYVQQERQMLHLDLKPENIFMTSDGRVKVADFGLANIGMSQRGAGGTGAYMSPEVAEGFVDDRSQRKRNTVDYHSDTWTLGVIGREMFSGVRGVPSSNPQLQGLEGWESNPIEDTVEFAKNKDNRAFTSGDTQPLKTLGGYHQMINAMMDPDPNKRPTLEAIRKHEFVSDPILAAPELQEMLKLTLTSTSKMTPSELKAHNQKIGELNTQIELLAKH